MRVNWLAIIASAIVFFLFGGLWYGILFKAAWMQAVSIGMSAPPSPGGTYQYAIAVIMAFFAAYGIARVFSWRGNVDVGRGAFIGLSLGLLIYGSMTWMTYAFEMRGPALGWIDIGYVSLGMAIMGAIIAAWKPKAA